MFSRRLIEDASVDESNEGSGRGLGGYRALLDSIEAFYAKIIPEQDDEQRGITTRAALSIPTVILLGFAAAYPAAGGNAQYQRVASASTAAALVAILLLAQPSSPGRLAAKVFEACCVTLGMGSLALLPLLTVYAIVGCRGDPRPLVSQHPAWLGVSLSLAALPLAILPLWASSLFCWPQVTPRLAALATLLAMLAGATTPDSIIVAAAGQVIGVLAGTLIASAVAVAIHPTSEGGESLKALAAALGALRRLCEGTWQGRLDREWGDKAAAEQASSCSEANPCNLAVDRFCTQALADVQAALRQLDRHLEHLHGEVLLGRPPSRLFALSCGDGWSVPLSSVERLALAISWVAGVFMRLYEAFGEGAPPTLRRYLRTAYPRAVIEELHCGCKAMLNESLEAFPTREPEFVGLPRLLTAVDQLMKVSDFNRRPIMEAIRAARKQAHTEMAGQGWAGYHSEEEEEYESPMGSLGSQHLCLLGEASSPAAESTGTANSQIEGFALHYYDSKPGQAGWETTQEPPQAEEKPAASNSGAVASFIGRAIQAGVGHHQLGGLLPPHPPADSQGLADSVEVGPAGSSPASETLGQGSEAHVNGHGAQVLPPADLERMASISSHLEGKGVGAFHMPFPLQEVLADESKLLQDTPESCLSLVQWCRFQFLAEELAEALVELHESLKAFAAPLPTGAAS